MVKDKFQIVYVTLSNGKIGQFMGPVLVTKKDQGSVQVTGLEFSLPKKMEKGLHWENIESNKEEK